MQDEDQDAFRRAMQGVRPLADRPSRPVRLPERTAVLLGRARRARARRAGEIATATQAAAAATSAEVLRYRRADLGPTAWSRLRRGRLAIEAEVDLHGLDRHSAQQMLVEFLVDCLDHEHRAVRVICGKGHSSGPDGPVLRRLVGEWLSALPEVAGYAEARPGHGGSGALYVLLAAPRSRRRR